MAKGLFGTFNSRTNGDPGSISQGTKGVRGVRERSCERSPRHLPRAESDISIDNQSQDLMEEDLVDVIEAARV